MAEAESKDDAVVQGASPLEIFLDAASRGDRATAYNMHLGQPPVGLDDANATGNTALHLSSGAGHTEIVRWLLAEGASPNAINAQGDTALHKAAWRDRPEVVQALLAGGCDKDVVNQDGKIAYDLARSDAVRELLVDTPIVMAPPSDSDSDSGPDSD